MSKVIAKTWFNPLESRTTEIGFLLSGFVIGVVALSYLIYSPFPIRFLVWFIGIAFAGVAIMTVEWPRAFRSSPGEVPKGRLRSFLILSIPLAYILDSQICGLGFKACSTLCNVISFSMIGLGTATAVQVYRGKPVGALLVPMVVVGLIPHCTCHAPINTIFQSVLGGYSPTCQVIPLATTMFSISALRGFRTRFSAGLVGLLLIVTAFIAIGNPLVGFPWAGCVG